MTEPVPLPVPRPRKRKPEEPDQAPNGFARNPIQPTDDDLVAWQRGVAALTTMPPSQKLALTDGIAELREHAAASLGEAARRLEHLRHAPVEDIGGPVPEWRTLADISDDPPADLLLGMLEPDGPNLMYAAGGTGKGSTGAWMIRELRALGMRPMIYDPEGRPKEWARRCSGLGVDRAEVIYVAPGDLPTKLQGRPAWDIADYLGRVVRSTGADLLFIDSILPAIGIGEERLKSDAQAPYLYVAAFDALGIPSVSFGHPPRATPDGEPYGSVSWVNAMRLTWLGTPGDGDAHKVRWRPRKRNERGHIAGVLLTFAYDGKRLVDVTRDDDDESTREWILGALVQAARTVEDMADDLADESNRETTSADLERIKTRLRQALGRMKVEGLVAKQTSKRGSPWMLVGLR